MRANQRGSWLLKWFKLEAYIPNLVKERGWGGEKMLLRTNMGFFFFQQKINGFLEELSGDKKIGNVCLDK